MGSEQSRPSPGNTAGFQQQRQPTNQPSIAYSIDSVIFRRAKCLDNPVNLKKESVNIIQRSGNLFLEFSVDSSVDCFVEAWLGADVNEVPNISNIPSKKFLANQRPVQSVFKLNSSQMNFREISRNRALGIKVEMGPSFSASEINKVRKSDRWPLVVSVSVASLPGDPPSNFVRQVTFFHVSDDFRVIPKRQVIWLKGKRYEFYDLYGGSGNHEDVAVASVVGPAAEEYTGNTNSEDSNECVVCMSEPRDTAVLPCRHLCLCAKCAQLIQAQEPHQQKCPICRIFCAKLLTLSQS